MTGKEALKAMIDGEVVDPGNCFSCLLSMQLGVIIVQDKSSLENLTGTKWDLEMIAGLNGDCNEFSIYKEPEHVFKPFEQVLVRDAGDLAWMPSHYGWENEKDNYQYHCGFSAFTYCIPYKGNEHLLGTTDNA